MFTIEKSVITLFVSSKAIKLPRVISSATLMSVMKTELINKELGLRISGEIRVLPKKRLAVWKQAKGLWSKRRPNPVSELSTIRQEWEHAHP